MSIAVPLYGFGASGGSPNKSTIIVTAPTGSTVTCKMGSTTKTAAEKNGVWTFGGLDLGTWTITSTKGGDSATQDVAITRLTVEYVTIVYRITPEFTYTGDYEIVDDSDNPISDFANWKNNWKIRFLTSGTLTFTKLNGWNGQLDVFLVGGGGGSWYGTWGGDRNPNYVPSAAAGGGYTITKKNISVTVGTQYTISIGAGGLGGTGDINDSGKNGGNTTAFGATANGGKTGTTKVKGGDGGSGGAGYSGGSGGVDGADGSGGQYDEWAGGKGQGTTTREFAESAGKLYSTGGSFNKSNEVTANTGDGGNHGSAQENGHTGASGIVVVRNAREAA